MRTLRCSARVASTEHAGCPALAAPALHPSYRLLGMRLVAPARLRIRRRFHGGCPAWLLACTRSLHVRREWPTREHRLQECSATHRGALRSLPPCACGAAPLAARPDNPAACAHRSCSCSADKSGDGGGLTSLRGSPLRPASSFCASEETALPREAPLPTPPRPLRMRRYRKQQQALPAGGRQGDRGRENWGIEGQAGVGRCGSRQAAGWAWLGWGTPWQDLHMRAPGRTFFRHDGVLVQPHSPQTPCRRNLEPGQGVKRVQRVRRLHAPT